MFDCRLNRNRTLIYSNILNLDTKISMKTENVFQIYCSNRMKTCMKMQILKTIIRKLLKITERTL